MDDHRNKRPRLESSTAKDLNTFNAKPYQDVIYSAVSDIPLFVMNNPSIVLETLEIEVTLCFP
jgi:hypothetical protein